MTGGSIGGPGRRVNRARLALPPCASAFSRRRRPPFSATVIGPIFFEFIQRKGDEGFGHGNFRALFLSIEEDQIRRGVLAPVAAK